MPTQYYMRAYNTVLLTYVDWIVNDVPDSTGTFSGYSPVNLTNITVNRIVQSKILNFLKPNESLGGSDGNFFHVNSYDWRNVTPPLNVPSAITGIAVERGATSGASITNATNATPIQITATSHGLVTGQLVTITGVVGNLAANGTFNVTFVDANNFTLNGTTGGGAYTSGGTVYTPRDFSTLTWDESNSLWRFVLNTKGDGTTLGNHQQLRILNLFNDGYISNTGYIALGTNPASQGLIRVQNNQFAFWRNFLNNGDIQAIGVDNLNRIKLGSVVGDIVYTPGAIDVDGYIVHDGTSTNVPTTGFIREQNNTNIIAVRDSAAANDHVLLSTNNVTQNNNLVIGNNSTNFGYIIFNTLAGNLYQFQTGSTTFLEKGTVGTPAQNDPNNFMRFTAATVAPSIYQTHVSGSNGQTLNFQAQSTITANTGGTVQLTAGSALTGGFGGTVDFLTGSNGAFPVAATLKMRIHPTVAPTAANNNSIQIFENLLRIDTAQTSPRIRQDDVNISSTPGQTFTLQSQNAIGATSAGGDLNLTSGTGTTVAGFVNIQTGGVTRVQISPTQTTIFGNLLVGGTSTSIASTVVELADRVINLNSSANSFPANAPIPTDMAGIAIDRGTTGGSKRNYHGLFWDEPDGYWKLAVSTDGYTTQTDTALTTTLPLILQYAVAQPTATRPVTVNVIPTVGGFRVLNNTSALASRNAAASADLPLVGTDASNHLLWGSGTNNNGTIFNTTTGTIYDFQVNSVSTYTITPQSAGTTTLQAIAAVTTLVYSHQTTAGATGANTIHQAQSAATNGGNLILSSGKGSGTSTDGYVGIETGNVDRIKVLFDHSEFRDANEALRITPVSTGTTQITYASTVTTAQINQTQTTTAVGAPMTIQSQVTTLNGSTGGNLSLIAGNATGTTATGGNAILASGTGTTVAGNTQLQTGGVDRVVVHPTFTEFRDTAEALRITPVSAGTTSATFAATVTAVTINQTLTASTPSANWTIQSQVTSAANGVGGNISVIAGNATGTTSTGGNAIVTSGTGTTVAGNAQLQTGGVDRVVVHPTFTEFRDTAEAYRITPVSAGATTLQAINTATSVTYKQGDLTTNSGTGATTTIQAQHETGTTSIGGALNLTSGTGTSTNGAVNLQVGTVTTASLVTNKFVFNLGRRRHTTNITTTYPVVATDDFIAITTLAAPFTITLPATPTVGDEYQIKDATGNAGVSNVTVSGNGNNIDGAASFLLSQPYAAATFTFVNGQWSVS